MKIYELWDHDPMASSMGADYLAKTFAKREDAEAERDRRNAAAKARFVKEAQNGRRRAESEPWNWQHARVEERVLE